jgi:enoyl-CoA hydratase/carnithine racemase
MPELIDIKRDGPVARVVMHRKGNNGIAEDLMSELSAAFTELGDDPAVRVIVLASEYEKYFSVGADLTMLAGIDRDAADATDQIATPSAAAASSPCAATSASWSKTDARGSARRSPRWGSSRAPAVRSGCRA